MRWNKWVRQVHRWLSIVFTLAAVANIVVNVAGLGEETIALWVGISALLPLVLLMLSGLYLFVLPYTAGERAAQRADGLE